MSEIQSDAGPGMRLHPDVVWWVQPNQSSRLFHLGKKTHVLDAFSTRLLRLVLRDGEDAAAASTSRDFGVPEQRVREDTRNFVAGLEKEWVLVRLGTDRRIKHRVALMQWGVGLIRSLAQVLHLGPLGQARLLLYSSRFSLRWLGWAETVRLWDRSHPQPEESENRDASALDRIDSAVRVAASRSLVRAECKERSLACLALFRGSGVAADLVVGMNLTPFEGHVWVEAGGKIFSDHPEHCRIFEPFLRYTGGGKLQYEQEFERAPIHENNPEHAI
jgi:hypothetical protein